MKAVCVLGVGIGLSFSAIANAQVSTSFDTDLEGWTVYNDGAIAYSSTVGNPAGAARMEDFGSGTYFGFLAPPAYHGDKSAYYGGTLSFDIMINNSTSSGANQPDVQITGGGFVLVLDLVTPPADVWTHTVVKLDDSEDWRISSLTGSVATEEQIQIVLASVASIRIRGEFSTMTSDVAYLDNVLLAPGSDCLADTNGDGAVTPADFSAWVAAFNAMAPECDQNADGICSPADFSAWVANFNAGC